MPLTIFFLLSYVRSDRLPGIQHICSCTAGKARTQTSIAFIAYYYLFLPLFLSLLLPVFPPLPLALPALLTLPIPAPAHIAFALRLLSGRLRARRPWQQRGGVHTHANVSAWA